MCVCQRNEQKPTKHSEKLIYSTRGLPTVHHRIALRVRLNTEFSSSIASETSPHVYERVTGWHTFEPSLTRAEQMDADTIWRCAAAIPAEWYEGDRDGLHRLVDELYNRRRLIRKLISIFRESIRQNPLT
jgi:hypothetical protein